MTAICAHTGLLHSVHCQVCCQNSLKATIFPNVPGPVLGGAWRVLGGRGCQTLPPALPSATPPSSQPSLTCGPREKKVLRLAFPKLSGKQTFPGAREGGPARLRGFPALFGWAPARCVRGQWAGAGPR